MDFCNNCEKRLYAEDYATEDSNGNFNCEYCSVMLYELAVLRTEN